MVCSSIWDSHFLAFLGLEAESSGTVLAPESRWLEVLPAPRAARGATTTRWPERTASALSLAGAASDSAPGVMAGSRPAVGQGLYERGAPSGGRMYDDHGRGGVVQDVGGDAAGERAQAAASAGAEEDRVVLAAFGGLGADLGADLPWRMRYLTGNSAGSRSIVRRRSSWVPASASDCNALQSGGGALGTEVQRMASTAMFGTTTSRTGVTARPRE
jgi:hypothetical protein